MATTQITAEPAVPQLVIISEFAAPRDLLFRAYTDPELLVRWLGPRGLTLTIDHLDPRHGGTWRYIGSACAARRAVTGVTCREMRRAGAVMAAKATCAMKAILESDSHTVERRFGLGRLSPCSLGAARDSTSVPTAILRYRRGTDARPDLNRTNDVRSHER